MSLNSEGERRMDAAIQEQDEEEEATGTRRKMDVHLRAISQLDWMVADLPPEMRSWAIGWLQAKYGTKE